MPFIATDPLFVKQKVLVVSFIFLFFKKKKRKRETYLKIAKTLGGEERKSLDGGRYATMLGVSECDKGKQCVPAAYSRSYFLRGREWLADARAQKKKKKSLTFSPAECAARNKRRARKAKENKGRFAAAICCFATQSVTILRGLSHSKTQTHTQNK